MPPFPVFAWAVGEEASDPVVTRSGVEHRVDELDLSGHLVRQDDDLADIATLGVRIIRYGMPWRRTEVEPGRYDWQLWDTALAACERHDLIPVIDLCHFGLPDHLPGFCEPSWVDAFTQYTEAFLARYRDPSWFTPINEPLTTALMAGRLGAWNDRRRSTEDFALALALCALANLEAHAMIRSDRDGWSIGAEALSIPVTPPADERSARREALGRATWDLHLGQPLDPLAAPAFATVPDAIRSRIAELATTDHVVAGHDLYPVSVAGDHLSIADRLDLYEGWAGEWHDRYRTPFWIAETSNLGLPVAQGSEWLDRLAARLESMIHRGLPVRGLCWYSRGDQFDWQTALIEPTGAITEVGLFDHERHPRPVATTFATLTTRDARPFPR